MYMKTKFFFFSIMILSSLIMLSGCGSSEGRAKEEISGYTDTLDKYFKAYVGKDYYTMQQYLRENSTSGQRNFENPIEGELDDPERLEGMGEDYGFTAFTYFLDEQQVFYIVQYKNVHTGHDRHRVYFGVEKVNGEYRIMNQFGNRGEVRGLIYRPVTGSDRMNNSLLRQAMQDFPEYTITARDY